MSFRNEYDHIVLGAGIVGSSTAKYLKSQRRNVVLIEQFPADVSNGGSSGKSRIIRKSYEEDYFAKMMVEAYERWKEIEEESGEQLIVTTGMILLGKACKDAIRACFENVLEFAGECLLKIDDNTMKEKYPQFVYPDYEKFREDSAGVILANKALSVIQKLFKQAGGIMYESCKVKEIIPGNPVTVVTTRGTFHTASLIITAGPWTNKVLQPLSIQLPIKTPKVRVYYWKEKVAGEHTKECGFPTFIDFDGVRSSHVYGLPALEYPGYVKICAHGGDDDCNPDEKDITGLTDYYIDELCLYVKQHFPGLEHEKPSIIETCIYSETPDRSFILDHHPLHKNIIIGAGFSGSGFKLGPLVGKILGDLALNVLPTHCLKPFLLSRFKI